jgi:hypothetical protein
MEKKEILQAFKQAEIDYSKHQVLDLGLCCYFMEIQSIKPMVMHQFLKPLWKKYATKSEIMHFNNNKERLEAIRKVINELENE